jgi:general secretion pathway protein G
MKFNKPSTGLTPMRFLHRRPQRVSSQGFTLLELLVVMVIIGLLAGFVGPKYFSQIGKSNVTVTKSQIESFSKSLEIGRASCRERV